MINVAIKQEFELHTAGQQHESYRRFNLYRYNIRTTTGIGIVGIFMYNMYVHVLLTIRIQASIGTTAVGQQTVRMYIGDQESKLN